MYRQSWADQDFAESISAGAAAAHASFNLYFKIRVLELGAACQLVERGGEAAGQGTKQQLLRGPSSLQAAQLRRLGEMDRVRRRLALRQSSAARCPPGRNAIGILCSHVYTPGAPSAPSPSRG